MYIAKSGYTDALSFFAVNVGAVAWHSTAARFSPLGRPPSKPVHRLTACTFNRSRSLGMFDSQLLIREFTIVSYGHEAQSFTVCISVRNHWAVVASRCVLDSRERLCELQHQDFMPDASAGALMAFVRFASDKRHPWRYIVIIRHI
jgi:hypothetical protein